MKAVTFLLIGVGVVAAGAWYFGGSSGGVPASKDEVPSSDAPPLPTTTNTDATEVFQRAFWKRPTEQDEILHAERREWADGDGVDRWQWFIAVDPSAELARYLHEQNPFSMSPPKRDVALPMDELPDWFPSSVDGYEVTQTADGQMIFLLRPDDGRLFATSQGRGFAKAVEAPPPSPPVISSNAQGRLPATPPPTPPPPTPDP